MAASGNRILVNDNVQIDGSVKGRVISIVKPLGMYTMYNIGTYVGEMREVSGYRLSKLPDTVDSRFAKK